MKSYLKIAYVVFGVLAFAMQYAQTQTVPTAPVNGSLLPPPTNTTQIPTSGLLPPTNSSQPAPTSQPMPMPSQPSPSGMFGSMILPPLEQPQLTTNLAAITDPYVVSLKNVLMYLPPHEQDLIASCVSSNTDTTRIVDPSCFKANFTSLKSQTAKGVGAVFTNSSQTTRSSLGCLSKISQTFGNSTDTAATNLNTALSTIVAQQTTMNNCAAAFAKSMIQLLNGRRRFFLTTKTNIDATTTKDAQGNVNGFVYNTTEQSDAITAFKTYAGCLNTFVSAFSTNVVSAQALVGQMGNCKAPATTLPVSGNADVTNTTAPNGSGPAPSGASPFGNSGSGPKFDANGNPVFGPPAGLLQSANATYSNMLAKANPSWTTVANKIKANFISSTTQVKGIPSLHMMVLNNLQNANSIKQEFDRGMRQDKCNGDYLFYCTSGSCYCNDSDCPSNIAGVTAINVRTSNVQVLADPTATSATTPGRLRYLQTAPTGTQPTGTPPSGTPPTGTQPTGTPPTGTQPTGTQPTGTPPTGTQPTGTQPTGTPPTGVPTNGTMPSLSGLIPSSISGMIPSGLTPSSISAMIPSGLTPSSISGMIPSGMNMTLPSSLSGMIPSGLTPSSLSGMIPSGMNMTLPSSLSGLLPAVSGSGAAGSGAPPKIPTLNIKNPTQDMNSYYIAEGCISGQRFIYSEMNSQIQGNIYDFVNQNPQQGGIGKAMAQTFNNCGNALKGGNTAQIASCRGQMNSECSNALDNSCKNSGLYSQLVSLPQSASAYPDACNDSMTGYSEASCFDWIITNLSKATMIFDHMNFQKLPSVIYNSISANAVTSSRLMRVLATVTVDATQTDSKALVDGSISNADMTIDSATATTVPNPNTYVAALNTATAALSSSFVNVSISLISILILGLFF